MQPKHCRAHCKQLESVSRCMPAAETIMPLLGPGFAGVSRYAVTLKPVQVSGVSASLSDSLPTPLTADTSTTAPTSTAASSTTRGPQYFSIFVDCDLLTYYLNCSLHDPSRISCFSPGQTATESGLSTGALAAIIIVCAAPCPTSCCFVFFDLF